MAQDIDVSDRLPASGEHGCKIDPDLASVMPRRERTAGQRRRQRLGQTDPLRQQPGRNRAGKRHNT